MKSNSTIVACLQDCVAIHWTAIQAYKSQQHQFARLGYNKLADRFKADVAEEIEHLDRLVERLEQFDVSCDQQHDIKEVPRMPDIRGILNFNLALETSACECERECVSAARDEGDEITAKLVAENLEGSEEAIVAFEADLRQLDAIGEDNWLADKL